MEADPDLADLKLVSEPWDCGGLYRLADFPARRIAPWNGRWRDDVRRFWKGDERSCWALGQRLAGSPDLFHNRTTHLPRSTPQLHFRCRSPAP
jgi:glycogen operon protein